MQLRTYAIFYLTESLFADIQQLEEMDFSKFYIDMLIKLYV